MRETYHYDAPDETIRGAFEFFGEATPARGIKDKNSGQSREFGFAGIPLEPQAETAIKSLGTPTPAFNRKLTAFLMGQFSHLVGAVFKLTFSLAEFYKNEESLGGRFSDCYIF